MSDGLLRQHEHVPGPEHVKLWQQRRNVLGVHHRPAVQGRRVHQSLSTGGGTAATGGGTAATGGGTAATGGGTEATGGGTAATGGGTAATGGGTAATGGGTAATGGGTAGTGGGTPDAGCSMLTVKNYLAWCTVTVNGGTPSGAASQTACVTPGSIPVSAVANTGFELGLTPWHDTSGDTGSGEQGTITGSGQTASTATTVVVGSSAKCAWVCCETAGTTDCPTSDLCP